MGSVLGGATGGKGTEEVDGVSEGGSGGATMRAGNGMEDKGGLKGKVEVLAWVEERVL